MRVHARDVLPGDVLLAAEGSDERLWTTPVRVDDVDVLPAWTVLYWSRPGGGPQQSARWQHVDTITVRRPAGAP